MRVEKKKMISENLPEKEKEKFGESGIKLLNLIAEILVENALKASTGKEIETNNQK